MKGKRVDSSRAELIKAAYFALGSYTEQESKKEDVWKDQTIGQLYAHIKHELEEIKRSKEMKIHLHNACDLASLSLIYLAKIMKMADL